MGNKSKVIAVCISEKKGIVKHAVDYVEVNEKGIIGDAHSGDWHRQISLLSVDSVNKMQSKIEFKLKPGAFAENILIDTGGNNKYSISKNIIIPFLTLTNIKKSFHIFK